MMELEKKLKTSDTFQVGDVLKLISGNKVWLGVYIDSGDVVYTETLEIPDDALFLRRLYYKLFPQLVTLGSLSDFDQVILHKRSAVQDSFQIVERAAYEVGRTTRLDNIQFVEYCCKNKKPTILVPALLTVSAVVLQRKAIDTIATAFFRDYFTVIRRMIFASLAYVTLSTLKDLTLVCYTEKTGRENDSGQTEGVRISYGKSKFEDDKSSTKNAELDLEDADVNKDAEIPKNCKQIQEDEDIDVHKDEEKDDDINVYKDEEKDIVDIEDEKDEEVNDSKHDADEKVFIIEDYKNEKDTYDTFDDNKEDEDVSDKREKDDEESLMKPENIAIFYTLEDEQMQIRRETSIMCRDYKEIAEMLKNLETFIDQEITDFPKSSIGSYAKKLLNALMDPQKFESLKSFLLHSTDHNIQVNYCKMMEILISIFKDFQTSARSIDTIKMYCDWVCRSQKPKKN